MSGELKMVLSQMQSLDTLQPAPPRLIKTAFQAVETPQLDKATCDQYVFLRRHGEPIHEQEVTRLMEQHARKPDIFLVNRAIAVLEHLKDLCS